MLNIYIGEQNIPKDLKFIFDVDKFCFGGKLRVGDAVTDSILSDIEQARVLSEYVFEDRFGYGLYVNNLSTGTKAILSAYYYPDYLINLSEAGANVVDLLPTLDSANVYFNGSHIEFSDMNKPISLNGVEYTDLEELNYAIQECDDYVKY